MIKTIPYFVSMKHFRFLILGLLAFSTIFLSSCHDKLNLNADYKDISIAYALLNPKDSIHYFKIYRGYLTEENAYEAALDWNNIYYPVDSIEVRLEEYSEYGVKIREAVLDTTSMVERESGLFAHPRQLLYYSNWVLREENTYRLVIKHVNSGKEVYAETPIVGNFSFRYPMQTWNMNQEKVSTIKFYAAPNAAAYDLYLHFYYIEVDKNTGAIAHKVMTKKLNTEFIKTTTTGEVSYTGFIPKTFYKMISQSLQPDDNIERYIDAINNIPYNCIRLQLWAAGKTYLTYYNVSNPGSSIVQNRLEYTNFVSDDNDAYGILSSRNTCFRDLQFSSLEHNEDTLVKGAATGHLGFGYYRNSPLFPTEK